MILLARTTPLAEVKKKREGMSIFIVDLREAIGKGLTVRPIANMVNHETNELFFDNLEIPAENLIGEEGKGFKYILDGLNAERTLIAAECIGDGYWFIDRVTQYAKERVVFGRPIGQNQGVQFPIAEAYIEVEAANLMRWKACELFDAHQPCGAEANMAKYLAAKASLGGGQRLPAVPRRLRLRLRIRRRAQVPRDAAVPGGADLDQPDPVLRGRACARPAALLLSRHDRRPDAQFHSRVGAGAAPCRARLPRRGAARPADGPAGAFVDGLRRRVQPRAGRARLGRHDAAAKPTAAAARTPFTASCWSRSCWPRRAGGGALDRRPAERPADPALRHRGAEATSTCRASAAARPSSASA